MKETSYRLNVIYYSMENVFNHFFRLTAFLPLIGMVRIFIRVHFTFLGPELLGYRNLHEHTEKITEHAKR